MMRFKNRRGTAPLNWWLLFMTLVIAFLVWLWKIVQPPLPPLSVTLTAPASVRIDDYTDFTGTVKNGDGTPAKGEPVALKLYKPDGTVGFEGSAVTWADQDPSNSPPGTFEFAWLGVAPEGSWQAEASVRGAVSGRKTFIKCTAWTEVIISSISPRLYLTKFI